MEVTSEHPAEHSTQPTGLGKLARLIARRTTDLLAIAIVAAGLLAVGGRVSEWWATDAESFETAAHSGFFGSASPWESAGGPVSLDLGDGGYRLHRQIVDGDRTAASDAVVKLCHRVVEESEAASASSPDEAERQLLKRLEAVSPIEQQPGAWRLYQLPETLPVVVGTRRVDGPIDSQKGEASKDWRVVCWALAFPTDETQWTIFTAQTSGERTNAAGIEIEPMLPPGSRRIMSLRAATGETFVAFNGSGPADQGVRFFDTRFEQTGWQRMGGWNSTEKQHTGRFRNTDANATWLADVHFQEDAGHWQGLLQLTPVAKTLREEQQ